MKEILLRPFVATLLILAVPCITMQVNTGVNWSGSDFVLMGALLFGAGLLLEVAVRKFKTTTQRVAAAAIIIFLLLIVWVDLAVGIFNIPGFSGS